MRTLLICAPAVVLAATAVGAQARHAPKIRRHVRQAKQGQPGAQAEGFQFGDVTLSNYTSIKGDLSTVRATGLKVLVTTEDPKAGSSTRLTAREFIATRSKLEEAQKVEARGSLHFEGVRPAVGRAGVQSFTGSGSSGVYFKQEGRLVVEGPVSYFLEQPTVDGKEKQWVRGTADRATYEEKRRILTLTGHVDAKMEDPGAFQKGKPSTIVADEAVLDFSQPTVQFEFKNASPESGRLNFVPKMEPRKEKAPSKGNPTH